LVAGKREQVVRQIRSAIEAGTLRDGDVLPSTRQMAADWEVSSFTIQEAMKDLVDAGLVRTKSRSMRIVVQPDQPSARVGQPGRNRPVVLLVGGYAGSGKSEFSRILARATGWAILDKDTASRPAVELALEARGLPPEDRESETYVSVIRPREYEGLMSLVVENVECGTSVVATAPFLREFSDPAWVGRTTGQLEQLGAVVRLVWVRCDAESMYGYLRHRGAARDAAKLADWPGYLSQIDPDGVPAVDHFLVENSTGSVPLQAQAKQLLDEVRAVPSVM
jgi:predicted kinase